MKHATALTAAASLMLVACGTDPLSGPIEGEAMVTAQGVVTTAQVNGVEWVFLTSDDVRTHHFEGPMVAELRALAGEEVWVRGFLADPSVNTPFCPGVEVERYKTGLETNITDIGN